MAYRITDNCDGCTACVSLCPAGAIRGVRDRRHSIDPAACIACGACGRICPRQAVLDGTGRFCSRIKRRDWPRPHIDRSACMACLICVDTCPAGCFDLDEAVTAGDPHAYPVLARAGHCLGCGFCADDCPAEAITMSAA